MTFRFLKPSRYATFLLCGRMPLCRSADGNGLARSLFAGRRPLREEADPSNTASRERRRRSARHLATAREMEAHGNTAAAVEQYEQALHFDAEAPGVQARLAVLYEQLGMHETGPAPPMKPPRRKRRTRRNSGTITAGYQLHAGRPADAEQSARRALALDGEHREPAQAWRSPWPNKRNTTRA